ncbi:MAG: metallophosphoesterase [Gemmatimonadetes bacterium]|nr:metallophosphoesterase [Gemmatimonadota bacterium]
MPEPAPPGAPPSVPGAKPARNPFLRFLAGWLAWTALCWGIVGAAAAPLLPGGWWTVALVAVCSVAPAWVLAAGFRKTLYPGAALRLWVVRPFWYLQLAAPLLATGTLLGFLAGAPFGAAGAGGRLGVQAAAAFVVAISVAGYLGSRRVVVRRLEAAWPDLPPELDGLRVVQLSDLHVGPHTPRGHLARVRRALEAEAPDLVAFTGDQVDDFPRDTEPFARAFAGVTAPLGVFAIPGNHDVYAGWPEVRLGLETMELTVLVNDAVPVRRGGATLWVAGTGDPAGGYRAGGVQGAAPDLPRTLARVPRGAFVLALAHNPALWPGLAQRGVALTLSGHTHYGQLAIPRLGWCAASPFLEYAMGAHRAGNSLLYVHPGTNYWGVPFRLGTPAEVAVITLRRGAEPGVRPAAHG